MFKKPFSFEGRIRRTEYGITVIIHMVTFFVVFFFIGLIKTESSLLLLLLYLPVVWLMFSQGAKRCHDLGNNGWFQLIPFYGLLMLFQDGVLGDNNYGDNPKGAISEESYDDLINSIGKSLQQ